MGARTRALITGFPFNAVATACPVRFILLPGGTIGCTMTFNLGNLAGGVISELRYDDGVSQPVTSATPP